MLLQSPYWTRVRFPPPPCEFVLMKKSYIFLIYLTFLIVQLFPLNLNIRAYDHNDFTRIVFEGDRGFDYNISHKSSNDLTLGINEIEKLENYNVDSKGSNLIQKVEHTTSNNHHYFKISFNKKSRILKNFVLEKPFRVVFDITPLNEQEIKINSIGTKEEENNSTSLESTPITKKDITIDTICIDPGHGGLDLGAVGRGGVKEKDVTLIIAKKLRSRVERNLGLRVIMTRETDVEVALDSRVSKANNQKAQLFLSIHVNSSFRRSARGPETYYVSLKATDQSSFRLAQKENGSGSDKGDTQGNDELKMILWSMAQSEYIKESSKLADYIQGELNIVMNTVNRGVKQAPFRVLMRASMPAVLVEIAFVSNKYEELKLNDDTFLDSVADAIYRGVSKFIYYYNNRFK